MSKIFSISSSFQPAGDQPQAIESLCSGLSAGESYQTLLGVTGSGKTFTMAHVIMRTQRPALIMAHNKTLAAQLYAEMRSFFPNNAVEYFVSYYDYYQPEAYVPSSDTFIEKDASINDHVDQMRLSATKSLLERQDVIIIATVSAIYGLGDPKVYHQMIFHCKQGDRIHQRDILSKLSDMQYTRNNVTLLRGTFRVRGECIDIFPAESEKKAIRIIQFDDEIESLISFDPLTGKELGSLKRTTIYPKSHYVTAKERVVNILQPVQDELNHQLDILNSQSELVAAERLAQRTYHDLELLREIGYCNGIENYSRYLSGREAGDPPPTLFDYLPDDALLFVDESHVTIPQIGAMHKGDRSRKTTLVQYGFRLPSALDNRPLRFDEFEGLMPQTVFVSATPGDYEIKYSSTVVEQIVRPTGLTDPTLIMRPVSTQIDDLLSEIRIREKKKERVLVTTLTKKMSENLADYLHEQGVKARYLHSDIDTVERVELIHDLRKGVFDVLIGINLLREGLDLPEVSLVAILDADKEGFLRSTRALIQTIGRAARHVNGSVILYADRETNSIKQAVEETNRRRQKQEVFNKKHSITPKGIIKPVRELIDVEVETFLPAHQSNEAEYMDTMQSSYKVSSPQDLKKLIQKLEREMYKYSENLDFEKAAKLRDQIQKVREQLFFDV